MNSCLSFRVGWKLRLEMRTWSLRRVLSRIMESWHWPHHAWVSIWPSNQKVWNIPTWRNSSFKGTVHPKMTILSLFTHSCVVQKRLLFLWRLESFSVVIIAWKKATGTVNADRIYTIILWMNLFSESGWFMVTMCLLICLLPGLSLSDGSCQHHVFLRVSQCTLSWSVIVSVVFCVT